jgi:hypothetical protein
MAHRDEIHKLINLISIEVLGFIKEEKGETCSSKRKWLWTITVRHA